MWLPIRVVAIYPKHVVGLRQQSAQSVLKRVPRIEVFASTLILEFIGTSADVDFP